MNSSHRVFFDDPRPRACQASPSRYTPPPTISRKSPTPVNTPRSSSPSQTNSNQTPLLTATLNAPPQAYYGNSGTAVRLKQEVHLSKKTVTCEEQTLPEQSCQQSQTGFYSALLKQLRQKAGPDKGLPMGAVKVRRQERPVSVGGSHKPLPFMCPTCKKRFQRHIAMAAHFKNEHISAANQAGEMTCKLCGHMTSVPAAMRSHLVSHHNIDLDNPARCLVEDTSKCSVLEASLRSGSSQEEAEPSTSNLEMDSPRSLSPGSQLTPSPAHTPSSSESPERSLCLPSHMYQEDDSNIQVEDLSVRKPSPPSPTPRSDSHRPAKRSRLPGSPTLSSCPKFCCTICNISYPNQTLYFLHKGFHSESDPWKCNSCGYIASDLYDFNTHLFSVAHQ